MFFKQILKYEEKYLKLFGKLYLKKGYMRTNTVKYKIIWWRTVEAIVFFDCT